MPETLGSLLTKVPTHDGYTIYILKGLKMKLKPTVAIFITRAIVNIDPSLLRTDLINFSVLRDALEKSELLVKAIATKDKVAFIRELMSIVAGFEGAIHLTIPESFCKQAPHIKIARDSYEAYELSWKKANLGLREAKDIADVLFIPENIDILLSVSD